MKHLIAALALFAAAYSIPRDQDQMTRYWSTNLDVATATTNLLLTPTNLFIQIYDWIVVNRAETNGIAVHVRVDAASAHQILVPSGKFVGETEVRLARLYLDNWSGSTIPITVIIRGR